MVENKTRLEIKLNFKKEIRFNFGKTIKSDVTKRLLEHYLLKLIAKLIEMLYKSF